MNHQQIDKRQVGYAKRLFAKKLIDRRVYGLMLLGWAEYHPWSHAVNVFTRKYRGKNPIYIKGKI